MRASEFSVNIHLHRGGGAAFYYTSDLTYEYVKINAEYHT
jgi:glutamate N-acetyltransferase/amino-acid N-acetyltransferase